MFALDSTSSLVEANVAGQDKRAAGPSLLALGAKAAVLGMIEEEVGAADRITGASVAVEEADAPGLKNCLGADRVDEEDAEEVFALLVPADAPLSSAKSMAPNRPGCFGRTIELEEEEEEDPCGRLVFLFCI